MDIWWIGVQVAPKESGQEQRLHVGDHAQWDLFIEVGMYNFFLFPFLPGNDKFFPCLVRHDYGARLRRIELLRLYLVPVHQA